MKIKLIAILFLSGIAFGCKKPKVAPISLGSEVTMSSPILKLGESWSGNMAGLLDVVVHYDTTNNRIHGTVTNVSGKKLCWTLSEPHLKMGNNTVGELGPQKLGDLAPGEQAKTDVMVASDPKYSGYTYDGYVMHMEVYDCSAGVPAPY